MIPDTAAQAGGQLGALVTFIQLAIAPVFLLTAIGAMLGTMTYRVARIVDRAREMERQLADKAEDDADGDAADRRPLRRRNR